MHLITLCNAGHQVKVQPQVLLHYKLSYLYMHHADYKQTQAGLFSPLPALYVLA